MRSAILLAEEARGALRRLPLRRYQLLGPALRAGRTVMPWLASRGAPPLLLPVPRPCPGIAISPLRQNPLEVKPWR